MFVKAVYIREKKTVHYFDENGNETLYIGGSFAWRCNNPGNVGRPGKRVVPAIGYAQRLADNPYTFCIFADRETGERERVRLLKTTYKDATISEMIYKYAPPKENDTEGYINIVTNQAKVSRDDVVGDISDAQFAQMIKAMGKHEGWEVGTIKELGKPAKVALQDKLQQPLVNKPIQLKSADKKIELKTDHRGELPSIYPKLFKEEVDLLYDGLLKTKEKIGQIAADWTGKGMTLIAPYYTVTAKPDVHQAKKPLPKTFHIVKKGETLADIAGLYTKSVDDFVKLNKLKDRNKIFDRQHLLIPGGAAPKASTAHVTPPKSKAKPKAKPVVKPTAKPVAKLAPKQTALTLPKPAAVPQTLPGTAASTVTVAAPPPPPPTVASQSTQSSANNNPVTVVSSAPLERSGAIWVSRFKGSKSLDSLSLPFRENAKAFVAAMEAAGMHVKKNAAFRPIERSYMMYYAFKICKGLDVKTIPPWPGVNIDWAHRNAAGVANEVSAKQGARAMCDAFEINPDSPAQKVGKPKKSRHNYGAAIDLKITSYVGKTMKNKSGANVVINSFAKLVEVGATYDVNYYTGEKMHWSDTGN